MATRAVFIEECLPLFQSWLTDVATVNNWLSAVDIIAERTAAVIIPEKIGPNNLSLTKNRTLSGLPTVVYITFADKPRMIIPVNIIDAHIRAIIFPCLIA